MKLIKFLILIQVSLFLNISYANVDFPVTGEMVGRVNFWTKVYTEISTDEAYIHDSEDLTIIYKKVSLPKDRRTRHRLVKKKKTEIKKLINSIAKKNYLKLSKAEQNIADIIGEKTHKELRVLARNIRLQSGLKDRYYKGLKRSYLYLDYIKETFGKLNIPMELVFLPHVESSFNYEAYSKVGAAGIWQFMRATARIYKLKVSYIIDERRDPLKATVAAAKLLKDNYRLLKSWPLALTAYNHGPRSIKRAQKKLGTSDINKIIQGYSGRRFGFASKNFYATFMATVQISKDPTRYFKAFKPPQRIKFSNLILKKNLTIEDISKALKINQSTLKQYNPSIRKIAFRSQLYLPKNYELKVPLTNKDQIKKYETALSKIENNGDVFDLQRMHIVSRGESLFDIARIYRVSMNKIIGFNEISNPSRIFPGMKLKIPGKKQKVPKKLPLQKRKIVLEKKPTIKQEVSSKKYRENQKPGSFVSKVKTFFPAKGADNKLKASLLKTSEDKIPLPLENLESYHLDLVAISGDVYQLTIEDEETLGHFAEWANIKTNSIRTLNQMRMNQGIHRGEKIKVQIKSKEINNFKEQRNKYHILIQEDFYNSFKIIEQSNYKVRRGDTLSLILKRNGLPYWFLRKHQKDGELKDSLSVGQLINIPKVEATQ
jgi:membrane-bound lytic murein transglycosylase D